MRKTGLGFKGLALVLAIGAATGVHADPNEYVVMPKVDVGEKEFDFKSGVQRNKDASSTMAHSIGVGYGVSSFWFSEVYAKYKREDPQPQAFDAWEWENKFQLTRGDKGPLLGILLEIEKPKDSSEGYELTYGPLIQKDWGKVQYNFNVLIQRHLNASAPFQTELHYQAQIKYKAQAPIQWGAQAFGNLGDYKHFSPTSLQEQKIGPAVFGKVKLSSVEGIKWNAAFLKGITQASPSSTIRLQVEYEYY